MAARGGLSEGIGTTHEPRAPARGPRLPARHHATALITVSFNLHDNRPRLAIFVVVVLFCFLLFAF